MLLSHRWELEDVKDVEGLIASVVDGYLGRRGAYLRPDLREDLDAYLLARTWDLYLRFDPSKASTPLSLSTFLTHRLKWAVTDWYRSTFTDKRRYHQVEVLSLDVESEREKEPVVEVELSTIATMNSTARGRFDKYGLAHRSRPEQARGCRRERHHDDRSRTGARASARASARLSSPDRRARCPSMPAIHRS